MKRLTRQLLLTLVLAVVPAAAASAAQPTLASPVDGATFTQGDSLAFTAHDESGPNSGIYVHVSRSATTAADGTIDSDAGSELMNGAPGPDYTATWEGSFGEPGTYYWQVYRIDCSTPTGPDDCAVESSVRSFNLVAPPPAAAPTPLSPADGVRVRIGRRINFSVFDDAPGAEIRILMSNSKSRDEYGVLYGDETDELTGGPKFSLAFTNWDIGWLGRPETMYWQPYRDECVRSSDTGCEFGGKIRRIELLPSSARISVPDRCYRERRMIPVTGRGFNPRKLVDVQYLGSGKVTRRTDGRGRFTARVPVPNMIDTPDTDTGWIWAYERGNSGNEPTAKVKQVAIAMRVSKTSGIRQGQKIHYWFSGFPSGRNVYGHYRLGGRLRGSQLIGKAKGPCGMVSARAELIPQAIERSGTWKVQFDARKRYSKRTQPRLRRQLTVFTIPGRVRVP